MSHWPRPCFIAVVKIPYLSQLHFNYSQTSWYEMGSSWKQGYGGYCGKTKQNKTKKTLKSPFCFIFPPAISKRMPSAILTWTKEKGSYLHWEYYLKFSAVAMLITNVQADIQFKQNNRWHNVIFRLISAMIWSICWHGSESQAVKKALDCRACGILGDGNILKALLAYH